MPAHAKDCRILARRRTARQQPDRAPRAVSRYENRRPIEEKSEILKVSARIKDRRLNRAEDLRKFQGYDAVDASRRQSRRRQSALEP